MTKRKGGNSRGATGPGTKNLGFGGGEGGLGAKCGPRGINHSELQKKNKRGKGGKEFKRDHISNRGKTNKRT